MKLIVQIPCFNEQETLPITVKNIPRKMNGIHKVEILVIDDGSTDGTIEAARKAGVQHIVKLVKHKGLAEAFRIGIDTSLKLGADIIVNTDADNQYKGQDIPRLIKPILDKKAELVIGCRHINKIKQFSKIKKILQKVGSWMVRNISNTYIPDVTSGFRVYSREAALKLNIATEFTHTLESIIQAQKKGIVTSYIMVEVNEVKRRSRLFSSIWEYLRKSIISIVRIYIMFNPFRTFFYIGAFVFSLGLLLFLRFLYFYFTGFGRGHIQSLILAAVLLIIGFQIGVIGLIADLISANRRLIEDVLFRIKEAQLRDEKNKLQDKT